MTEFDFLVRIAAEKRHAGELLYLLGLWPVKEQDDEVDPREGLDASRMFVDRLLGTSVAGFTPAQRIDSLRLLNPSRDQIDDLEWFLRSAATKPFLPALADLADKPHLWVNALRLEGSVQDIQSIELVPWRTNTGRIARWTGLSEAEDGDDPPVLILDPEADRTGDYSKLEVRWKARPDNLEKASVDYRVVITTDMDEEIVSRDVAHTGKRDEKYRFTNDDFLFLNDDVLIGAKVSVSVIGNDQIEPQESEEFTIRFGKPLEREPAGLGKKVRTLSEGLIELRDRKDVSVVASSTEQLAVDAKGFVLLRTPQRGKSFRVFYPPLIREIEREWAHRTGAIGRWRVKVRASGARAAPPEFVSFSDPASRSSIRALWDRVSNASRRMADQFVACSGVGQVYDEKSKIFDTIVKEYLLAWAALLEDGDPSLALANTVEVQSLSGRTIGLIVLPSHASRVAWHVAYDNLVLHTAFERAAAPKEIREQFLALDGAMFPAFLPASEDGSPFVFADTLGFHAVGMVPDRDKEPKAAIAMLARALGESDTADTVPTVGVQSALVLGNEIRKYISCHNSSKLLHIHALRPGDGLTVVRSLSRVQDLYRESPLPEEDLDGNVEEIAPAFVLELYPSPEQRGLAGRFIAEACEKRRSGAGVLPVEDRWMLESLSLPGGMNLPKLRWARKLEQDPKTPAHLAVAFDTFEIPGCA